MAKQDMERFVMDMAGRGVRRAKGIGKGVGALILVLALCACSSADEQSPVDASEQSRTDSTGEQIDQALPQPEEPPLDESESEEEQPYTPLEALSEKALEDYTLEDLELILCSTMAELCGAFGLDVTEEPNAGLMLPNATTANAIVSLKPAMAARCYFTVDQGMSFADRRPANVYLLGYESDQPTPLEEWAFGDALDPEDTGHQTGFIKYWEHSEEYPIREIELETDALRITLTFELEAYQTEGTYYLTTLAAELLDPEELEEEEVRYFSMYSSYNGDSTFNRTMVNNPIDSCPVINEKLSTGVDMRGACRMQATVWKDEMEHAFALVIDSLNSEGRQMMVDAQESYAVFAEQDIALYGAQYEALYGFGNFIPFQFYAHAAELYHNRTVDLIDLYCQVNDTPYAFHYTCPEEI